MFHEERGREVDVLYAIHLGALLPLVCSVKSNRSGELTLTNGDGIKV